MLNILLDFIQRDKKLSKDHSFSVCTQLILHWSQMNDWWKEDSTIDLKLAAVTLLQKIFTLHPKVYMYLILYTMCSCSYSYCLNGTNLREVLNQWLICTVN